MCNLNRKILSNFLQLFFLYWPKCYFSRILVHLPIIFISRLIGSFKIYCKSTNANICLISTPSFDFILCITTIWRDTRRAHRRKWDISYWKFYEKLINTLMSDNYAKRCRMHNVVEIFIRPARNIGSRAHVYALDE